MDPASQEKQRIKAESVMSLIQEIDQGDKFSVSNQCFQFQG